MAQNPPVDVQVFGQSIWYDNISRTLINSGEVQRLVDEDGVLGITSNPSIFQKAIANSDDYDGTIAQMLGADANTIFEALAIADIRDGADILRSVYDRTNGADGYISLEVSPLIANDTETTLKEALRLFKLVDRPNLMIKIPATPAGIPAIEESIASGVNINITLIFSVDNYVDVAEAYIRGLERRLEVGQDVSNIGSVASFFLSRIDAMVDQQLESNLLAARGRDLDRISANQKLLGQTAIANAKLAYREYQRLFEGERFAKLREAGAMVQRPLWASTSTKNPAYPDTLYVDTLIGANTVNTVPPATLKAFKDHGTASATLEEGWSDLDEFMKQLAGVGIDIERVTHALQVDGVEKFANAFTELMDAIEGKRQMLEAGVINQQSHVMGAYETDVRDMLKSMQSAPHQIWDRNAGWWKAGPAHQKVILNRLGWLDALMSDQIDRTRLAELQAQVKTQGWQHVVLLGMGGSSLAPEVMAMTFGLQDDFPALLVLDSTVPAAIQDIESLIDLSRTMFIVASKSGGTLETRSFFDYFWTKMVDVQGSQASEHFIIITDPGSALVKLAPERNITQIFENPADIGGRYSALSYFGLVPVAMMGLDLDKLYASAERMTHAIARDVPAEGNPALWLGVLMGVVAEAGRDKLSLLTSPQIESFGSWVEQLVAESTGKENEGVVPVVGATFGLPHDYDDDRLFVYLRLDGEDTEIDEKVQALWEAGHPVLTLNLRDAYDLGGEFLRWEFATAVVGQILGINPFDEPNVASAKKNTNDLLDIYQAKGEFPVPSYFFQENNVQLYTGERTGDILDKICRQRNYDSGLLSGLLAAHLSLARSGEYIGLLAYLNPAPEIEEAMEDIRRRLRHARQRAVTIGYGPRYLHSTGQLHKGGPNTGVFILITADEGVDLAIPDRPYSFGTLNRAQALGDLRSLQQGRRRVVHIHIEGDVLAGLRKLDEAIKATEAKMI